MSRRWRRTPLLVLAAAGALRLAHLGAPLTSDEGHMLQFHAVLPAARILSFYDAPNNHILLSLVLHALDAAWPRRLLLTLAPAWPLRLVSVLAAALSPPLLYAAACELAGPAAALLASAVFGVSFWGLLYSHMLRGYSASVFLTLLALRLALALRRGSRAAPWLLAVVLAASHLMVPSNLLYTLALGSWLCLDAARRPSEARALWAPLAAAGAAGAALSAAAYWPALGQLSGMARSASRPLAASLAASGPRLVECLGVAGLGLPARVFTLAAAAGGLAFGASRGRRLGRAAALAAVFLVVPPLAFTLQGSVPPARVYLPSLPFWCLAAGLGLAAAGARAAGARPAGAMPRRGPPRGHRRRRGPAPLPGLGPRPRRPGRDGAGRSPDAPRRRLRRRRDGAGRRALPGRRRLGLLRRVGPALHALPWRTR